MLAFVGVFGRVIVAVCVAVIVTMAEMVIMVVFMFGRWTSAGCAHGGTPEAWFRTGYQVPGEDAI
jgi:hypothetical protein